MITVGTLDSGYADNFIARRAEDWRANEARPSALRVTHFRLVLIHTHYGCF